MPDGSHVYRNYVAACLKLVFLVLVGLLVLRATFGPVHGLISARSTLNVAASAFLCLLALAITRRMVQANALAESREGQPAWQMPAVFVLAVVPYLMVLHAPFVFDDYVHLSNAAARLPLSLHKALMEHPSGGDGFFRPAGLLYFALALRLAGGSLVAWHLLGILLHACNTVLLLLLLRRLINSAGAAFGGALLFAWHGAHIEAVAWTAASFDLLAALFALVTLLVVTSQLSTRTRYGMGFVAALAACLSKESALCLPLLVFCLAGMQRDQRRRETWWAGLWVAAACGAEFLLRLWYLQGIGGYQTSVGSPMVLKVPPLGAIQALGLRLWALLSLPVNWSVALEAWAIVVIDAVLVMAALFVLRPGKREETKTGRTSRLLGFLIFTACAALPVVPILMLGIDLNGARILYLPSVGFCLLAAEAALIFAGRPGRLLIAVSALQLAALVHNGRIWLMETQAAARICAHAAVLLRDHPQSQLYVPDLPRTRRGVYFLSNGFPQCVAASQPAVSPMRVHTSEPGAKASGLDYVGRWNARDGELTLGPIR